MQDKTQFFSWLRVRFGSSQGLLGSSAVVSFEELLSLKQMDAFEGVRQSLTVHYMEYRLGLIFFPRSLCVSQKSKYLKMNVLGLLGF